MSKSHSPQDSNLSHITQVVLTFPWHEIESRNVNTFRNDFKIFSTTLAYKKKRDLFRVGSVIL